MSKRMRWMVGLAVFALVPMTMAAAGDGPGLLEKLREAIGVPCCVGDVCDPSACIIFSNCDNNDDCPIE